MGSWARPPRGLRHRWQEMRERQAASQRRGGRGATWTGATCRREQCRGNTAACPARAPRARLSALPCTGGSAASATLLRSSERSSTRGCSPRGTRSASRCFCIRETSRAVDFANMFNVPACWQPLGTVTAPKCVLSLLNGQQWQEPSTPVWGLAKPAAEAPALRLAPAGNTGGRRCEPFFEMQGCNGQAGLQLYHCAFTESSSCSWCESCAPLWVAA